MARRPDIYLHLREGPRKAPQAIGPGKVALLEQIEATGSITAAAKALGMSYRRAWVLLDETNRCLLGRAVDTATGGSHGGGATLTAFGRALVREYRALEAEAKVAAVRRLGPLLRPSRRGTAKPVPRSGKARTATNAS